MSVSDDTIKSYLKTIRDLDYQRSNAAFLAIAELGSAVFESLFHVLKTGELDDQRTSIGVLWRLDGEYQLSHPETCSHLLCLMRTSEDFRLRNFLHVSLNSLYNRDKSRLSASEILDAVFDEDELVRSLVIRWANARKMRELVPYLEVLLDDLDSQVSKEAQSALKTMGTPDALYALREWERRK